MRQFVLPRGVESEVLWPKCARVLPLVTALSALVLPGMASPATNGTTLTIEVSDVDCPSRSQVSEELRKVLPADLHVGEGGAPVWLRGTNQGVEVTFDGHTKAFALPDCEGRARAVAIHVALAWMAMQPREEEVQRRRVLVPRPRRNATSSSKWRDLQLSFTAGAAVLLVPGTTPVAELFSKAAWAGDRMGMSLGLGVQARNRHAFGHADALVTRFYIDPALRLQVPLGEGKVGVDLGPRATWMRVRGSRLSRNEYHPHLEPAVVLSPFVQFPLRRGWGLLAQLSGAWAPNPAEVVALPWGTLGSLPAWGLSTGLGVFWRRD